MPATVTGAIEELPITDTQSVSSEASQSSSAVGAVFHILHPAVTSTHSFNTDLTAPFLGWLLIMHC